MHQPTRFIDRQRVMVDHVIQQVGPAQLHQNHQVSPGIALADRFVHQEEIMDLHHARTLDLLVILPHGVKILGNPRIQLLFGRAGQ